MRYVDECTRPAAPAIRATTWSSGRVTFLGKRSFA